MYSIHTSKNLASCTLSINVPPEKTSTSVGVPNRGDRIREIGLRRIGRAGGMARLVSPRAWSLQEAPAASCYRCIKNKEAFLGGVGAFRGHRQMQRPRETHRSVQTDLSPRARPCLLPLVGVRECSACTCPPTAPKDGDGAEHTTQLYGQAGRSRPRVHVWHGESPWWSRCPRICPHPSSGPTPRGAVSGTREQLCQSSRQTGPAPSMWKPLAFLKNSVWIQSTPNALCALCDKGLGSRSDRL